MSDLEACYSQGLQHLAVSAVYPNEPQYSGVASFDFLTLQKQQFVTAVLQRLIAEAVEAQMDPRTPAEFAALGLVCLLDSSVAHMDTYIH